VPQESQSELSRAHLSRLRKLWRSAGWPVRDAIELDLLVHRYLDRHVDAFGRDCLSLSEAGVQALGADTAVNRRRLDRHESLCLRLAEWLVSQGRLAFLGSRFRAKIDSRWRIARPDVFSIRRTTRETGLAPIAYEVKVERSDLLGDLSRTGKRAGYLQVAHQLYYVLREGIAEPTEIPPECGVMIGTATDFRILRAAPSREVPWGHGHWMSLLSSRRVTSSGEPPQRELGARWEGASQPAPALSGDRDVRAP